MILAMTDTEQLLLALLGPAVSIVGLLLAARYLAGRQSKAVEVQGAALESLTTSTNQQVRDLSAAIQAEREARHQFFKELSDRNWSLAADLKENYPARRETMRQFSTLVQRLDALHVDMMAEIKALPCVGPRASQCTAKEGTDNG